MQNALDFAKKYPGWQGYAHNERATRDAIAKLAKLQLVEISSVCHSFRIKQ
jgi:hypothetical protein